MKNLTDKFIREIMMELWKRGIVVDVVEKTKITPIEYMMIKEKYRLYEEKEQ